MACITAVINYYNIDDCTFRENSTPECRSIQSKCSRSCDIVDIAASFAIGNRDIGIGDIGAGIYKFYTRYSTNNMSLIKMKGTNNVTLNKIKEKMERKVVNLKGSSFLDCN
jgi:hypothetical protein